MPGYFGALTLVLFLGMVLTCAAMLRRRGIEAINFGKLDKTDFLIPPFVLFYFYLVFASAFGLSTLGELEFDQSEIIDRVGVGFCLTGLGLIVWSLVSFGQSFRVGIDTETPDKLVTTGVFAFSRNPIYVGFTLVLLGEFLIFLNWIMLVYLGAAIWLFHRQVLKEDDYLKQHYGEAHLEYSKQVRRYL